MIHLHSLGQCMITLTAARVLPTARLMFASALYVAVEGTKSIVREQMASLLWPEMNEERATHALRQIFYRLRAHGMQLDGDAKEVIIPAGAVHRDYDALLAAEGNGVSDGLLEKIPGGFLPGYMPTVSAPFAEWVEGQRARVNASLRRQLVAGIAAQRTAGNWPETQKLAQRCLEIDPLNEEATLAYAEAMAMDGSKALAIMQIDRYLSEIGPRAKELHLPATMLKKRISELYPLPPVIERDPPHTGRDAEMARLDAALAEVRQGHGRAFVISGPPGIGKTRLATEFTRAAQLQGLRVARTGMGRHDNHRPLGAWCDLVRELRRMPGALGCDPESLPFLERLTSGTSGDSASRDEERDSEYLFARIRMAIVDLVCAVASESVLILWIEDVHWMDEWSWDVMSALTKKFEKTGVLVLMTRREGDEEGTPVPGEAAVEELELHPLGDDGCRRLLALVDTRPRKVDEGFAEWCVRTCAGNPYFLIELARRASRSDGKFLAPPSLTKLIAQRFEDVAPLSRRVLQAAAVLGRNSTLSRIEKVLDERRISLLASLDELTAHALLVTERERVVCRHDLLGMSALSGVSELSEQLLHRHAAEVLEVEIDPMSSPDHLWACAEHWERAGERERALGLVERCASCAIELGTPAEAVRVLEAAVAWQVSLERRLRLEKILVRAHYLALDTHGVVRASDALRNTTTRSSHTEESHSEHELCELDARHYAGNPDEVLLTRAVACSLARNATADHRVEAAIIACKMASNFYRPVDAREAFEGVQEIAPRAGPILRAELTVVYEGSFGSPSTSANVASELHQLARERANSSRRLLSLRLAALGLFVGGLVEEAFACASEQLALADSLRMNSARFPAMQGLARLHLALGNLDEAEVIIDRMRSSEFIGRLTRDEDRTEYVARLALLRGDDIRAPELVQDHFRRWTNFWPRKTVHRAALEALPRLRSGRWRPNDIEIVELLALHQQARSFGSHDFFVYALSYAFQARQESARFQKLFTEYVTNHRRERSPLLRQLKERVNEMCLGPIKAGL